jgi:hypothetical protein
VVHVGSDTARHIDRRRKLAKALQLVRPHIAL